MGRAGLDLGFLALSGRFSALPQPSTELPKIGEEEVPELVAHQEVEHRVDDAVQESQRPRQDIQTFDVHPRALLFRPQLPRGYPYVSQYMVGSVKDQEHGRGRGHDPEGAFVQRRLALLSPLPEQARDFEGEGAQGQQRENVAGHGQPQAVRHRIDVALQTGKVLATCPVTLPQVLDHQRYHGSHFNVDDEPGERRYEQGRSLLQEEVVSHGMLDEQKAVHAQPHHEENGRVEVDVQEVAVDDTCVGPDL